MGDHPGDARVLIAALGDDREHAVYEPCSLGVLAASLHGEMSACLL